MNQWYANLFYRGQSIDVIYSLDFDELKYWNTMHEKMVDEEKKAIEKMKKGK